MNFLDSPQPDLSLVKPLSHDQSLSNTRQKSNLVMPPYMTLPWTPGRGSPTQSDKLQFLQGPQIF